MLLSLLFGIFSISAYAEELPVYATLGIRVDFKEPKVTLQGVEDLKDEWVCCWVDLVGTPMIADGVHIWKFTVPPDVIAPYDEIRLDPKSKRVWALGNSRSGARVTFAIDHLMGDEWKRPAYRTFRDSYTIKMDRTTFCSTGACTP